MRFRGSLEQRRSDCGISRCCDGSADKFGIEGKVGECLMQGYRTCAHDLGILKLCVSSKFQSLGGRGWRVLESNAGIRLFVFFVKVTMGAAV